jgi:hypothetical protein
MNTNFCCKPQEKRNFDRYKLSWKDNTTKSSGKLIAYLPFKKTRTAYKTPPPILRCRGNVFTKPLPSNDRGIHTHRPIDSPLIRRGPYRWRRLLFFYCCVHWLPRERVYRAVSQQQYAGIHIQIHTDERDLWNTPLRWAQVPWHTYQVS